MIAFYFDSSAFTKRYGQEQGSEVVDRIFSVSPSHTIATSFLTLLEFETYLQRRQKTREIQPGRAAPIRDMLAQDLDRSVVVPLEANFVGHAFRLVQIYALKASDALQLSAAISCRELLPDRQWTLVSADDDLNAAARGESYRVLDPVGPRSLATLEKLLSEY